MSEERFFGSGGPPPSQFLQALITINTALNGQSAALNALLAAVLPTPLPMLVLAEIAVPAAPASGAILFVDAADHRTKIIGRSGTITVLALP